MKICMYGASSSWLEKSYYDSAYELGKKLAERKHTLVFGGGKQGLMGSCVRGIYENGGCSIGVSPKFFDLPDVLFEKCSEFIFTETMAERKQIFRDLADAFVIAPGGIGTYEEFFEILTLKQLGQMTKPIAIFNVNGYFGPMFEMLNHTIEEGFLKESAIGLYGVFTDIDEMLDYVETVKEKAMDLREAKY